MITAMVSLMGKLYYFVVGMYRKINSTKRVLIGLAVVLAVFGWFRLPRTAMAAAPNAVIINELMYNPASDVHDDEFLELYNTTASSIDLNGWCFTDGITLCFGPGDSITGHGYVVISANPARTMTTYSVTTLATYTGRLDNSGEKLTLKDNLGNTINSFTYDDVAPWPTSPDGTGPSLELKDPTYDNVLATSWGGSLTDGGTPGAKNSLTDADLPNVTNVTKPTNVQPSDTPVVTAAIDNTLSVNLVYKVMFDAEQTISMHDDGLNGDTTAGDGIFSAQVPAQAAGKLVRYKISAANINGTVTSPGTDDTVQYLGYVVVDTEDTGLPLLRWYMDPDDYETMITDHLIDEQPFPAVVAIGDVVIDNATVRTKGLANKQNPKKKYKFDLPRGYTIGAPYFTHPIDEFSINRWAMPTAGTAGEELAWKVAELAGFAPAQTHSVSVYRNSDSVTQDPQGIYLMVENYDNAWRQRNGYDEGAFYKEGHDKRTRLDEDDSDITALYDNLTNLSGQELKDYLYDNVDIPGVINYNALMTLLRATDWSFSSNIFQYRDSDGTQRWTELPWDLDSAFALYYLDGSTWDFDYPTTTPSNRPVENALYQFPEFQAMFKRRVSELYMQVYGQGGSIYSWMDEAFTRNRMAIDQDLDIWRSSYVDMVEGIPGVVHVGDVYTGTIPGFFQALDVDMIQAVYQYDTVRFVAETNQLIANGAVLAAQTANAPLVINELMYNPSTGNQNLEYIELYNPSSTPVDLSGWTFTSGINFTFPGGSVIPANSYALVVKNDTAFRNHYGGGKLILGQYSGNLSNEGETITLHRSNNSVASSFAYGTNGNWPSAAAGNGSSLALIRFAANGNMAACWAPSPNGGTPGSVNTPDQSWVDTHGSGCVDGATTPEPSQDGSLAQTGQQTIGLMSLAALLIAVAGLCAQYTRRRHVFSLAVHKPSSRQLRR